MFRWKRKRTKESVHAPVFIKAFVEKRMRKLSDHLQGASSKISVRKKRVILFLFCLLFGSVSVLVAVQSLLKRKTDCLYIAPIKMLVPLPAQTNTIPFPTEDPAHKRIHAFMVYVDSLQRLPDGKEQLNRLFHNRPHLLDTLTALEKIYHQSNNQK